MYGVVNVVVQRQLKNFTGVVKSGDLLLVGECAECHGDVARLIESK